MSGWKGFALVGLIACLWTGRLLAQAVQEEDVLTGLVGKQGLPLKDGEMRLSVALLRMNRIDAATLLLADGGERGGWEASLLKLKEEGRLKAVKAWKADGPGAGGVWEVDESKVVTHEALHGVAQFWDYHRSPREANETPISDEEFLESEIKRKVGAWLKVSYERDATSGLIDISEVELLYDPEPHARRPNKDWPIPGRDTSKIMFRPWTLKTSGRVAINEVFLLGAQMDVQDGLDRKDVAKLQKRLEELGKQEVVGGEPDEVLIAFGKVVGEQGAQRGYWGGWGLRLSTWTLWVRPEVFLPWLETRTGWEGDAAILAEWLKGEEVLDCSAMLMDSEMEGTIQSARTWQEPTGFEPGRNPEEFKVIPNEIDLLGLRHRLKAATLRGGQKYFVGEKERPWHGARFSLSLMVERPAAPVRWLKWKSAMERDDHDPSGISLAETSYYEAGESGRNALDLRSELRLGQLKMVGAGLRDGRVQVTFVRLAEHDRVGAEEPEAKPLLASRYTSWCIETPLGAWQDRMLGGEMLDPGAVAVDLLEALKRGEVKLQAVQHVEAGDSSSNFYLNKPILFMGGEYVNTAPHLGGVLFNPRSIEIQAVGDHFNSSGMLGMVDRWNEVQQASASLNSVGEPEWRQWGMWLPEVKGANAENSGMKRPEFPWNKVDGSAQLLRGFPKVVAVWRASHVSVKEGSEDGLRWLVMKLDVDEPAKERVEPAAFGAHDGKGMIQAMVLKGALQGEDEKMWMDALQTGMCEVVDWAVMTGPGGSIENGAKMHFMSARANVSDEAGSEERIFNAAEQMPEGTTFGYGPNQVVLCSRVVGFSLKHNIHNWEISRDAAPPKVVTDTFSEVKTEWPVVRPEDYEKLPKVKVNVQRPIFSIQKVWGKMPDLGKAVVKRLSDTEVILVRRVMAKP